MPAYVITGTRTGIGLEYVRQLAQSHNNTIFALVRSLTGGDLAALKSIQASPSSHPDSKVYILECDVSSPASIAALPQLILSTVTTTDTDTANTPLKIDVLLNNAATLHSRPETALTLTAPTLLSHMHTNVLGPALVFQSLFTSGLLSPTARVVNITSGIGSLRMVSDGRINAEITPYSISKTALNMFTVHQARQLRAVGSDVVVVAVDPGHVKTEMGGPAAVVEVEDSARGVLRVVEGLKEGDSGKFLLYNGEELEW
ncbi:NADP-dependent dehydrogenase-like protein [Apiosordaria backusii]|uniref:NADP-dependent dehydrogenase-like protein n=1 Tax=Apiosordaria backusii TaxID=314023 RepID=A0AA40ET30_9PEZI|nr:NADP-dependent dehydrogenase-like protein [Apiosordaria backusii]